MKSVQRSTEVISISLSKKTAEKLERVRQLYGQSRSALISSLINQTAEKDRWEKIYKKGAQTARKFKITSEEDIDRILHET